MSAASPARPAPPARALLLPALAVWALAAPAIAQTDVCGAITSDTTWSLAGSPYTVTCNVTVRNDATLTVEPGVEVRFDPGTTLWIGTATLGGGTLVADALGGAPILFTSSASSPAAGDWSGVEFLDSAVGATYSGDLYVSGSVLRGCTLEYADTAVKVRSTPALSGCLVRDCSGAGVTVSGAAPDTVRIIACVIEDNGMGISPGGEAGGITHSDAGVWVRVTDSVIRRNAGVFAGGISVDSQMILENTLIVDNRAALATEAGGIRAVSGDLSLHCTTVGDNEGWGILLVTSTTGVAVDSINVYGNSAGAVSNQTPENVDFTDIWWATTDSLAIDAEIEDCYDSPFNGCVDFVPMLATPACGIVTSVSSGMRSSTWSRIKAGYR